MRNVRDAFEVTDEPKQKPRRDPRNRDITGKSHGARGHLTSHDFLKTYMEKNDAYCVNPRNLRKGSNLSRAGGVPTPMTGVH